MSAPALSCRQAAGHILDGQLGPESQAHIATCAECAAFARDVATFARIVDAARPGTSRECDTSARALGPTPEKAKLRVSRNRDSRVSSALAKVRDRQRLRLPSVVAIAAGLVGLATAAVLLRERALPRDSKPERVAMGETRDVLGRPNDEPLPSATTQPSKQSPSVSVEQEKATPRQVTVRTAPRPMPTASVAAEEPSNELSDEPLRPPDAAIVDQARSTLESQRARVQRCYDRALRRDLRMHDLRAEITVRIEPNGSVSDVRVEGEAQGELGRCLQGTLRTARFPSTEDGVTISVPFRFEIQRERMGGNVGTTAN